MKKLLQVALMIIPVAFGVGIIPVSLWLDNVRARHYVRTHNCVFVDSLPPRAVVTFGFVIPGDTDNSYNCTDPDAYVLVTGKPVPGVRKAER